MRSLHRHMHRLHIPLDSIQVMRRRAEQAGNLKSMSQETVTSEGQTIVIEWHGETLIASGGAYSQDYCWVIRVNDDNEAIVEVRGYFDTELVSKLLANRNQAS